MPVHDEQGKEHGDALCDDRSPCSTGGAECAGADENVVEKDVEYAADGYEQQWMPRIAESPACRGDDVIGRNKGNSEEAQRGILNGFAECFGGRLQNGSHLIDAEQSA